jgi:hypothetical protein
MEEVKLQAQARIDRLATQKKTLSAELKDVTRAKREAVNAAHRQYKDDVGRLLDKVKDVTRLKNDELNKANDKHRDVVTKLELQKAELRERAKTQREECKERVSGVTAKSEALELLCSISEMESKKLGRELSAEQSRMAALGAKETLLVECLHNLEVENDILSQTLETKDKGSNDLHTATMNLRTDLAAKCAELNKVNTRFTKWKDSDCEFRRTTKDKIDGVRSQRDKLTKVYIFSDVFLS